jgi:hypothetical protein
MTSVANSETTDWAQTAKPSDVAAETPSSTRLHRTLSDETDTDDFDHEFKRKGPKYARAYAEDQGNRNLGVHRKASKGRHGPWLNTAVLSLDGGGIRGLSTLIVLRELMKCIADVEISTKPIAKKSSDSPLVNSEASIGDSKTTSNDLNDISGFRPCHYFDYIAGTSTGGLIAIMLGRLRMDVQQTIDRYLEIAWKVYAQRRRKRVDVVKEALLPKGRSRDLREKRLEYVVKGLEDVHRESDSRLTDKGREEKTLFTSDVARCRTIVLSLEWSEDKSSLVPFLFKSYDEELATLTHRLGNTTSEKPLKLHIAQVAMATSWGTSFREPLRVGKHQICGTGKVVSNPTLEVYNEITYLREEHRTSLRSNDAMSLFVSIGCGKGRAAPQHQLIPGAHHLSIKSSQSWTKVVAKLSEEVDRKMHEFARQSNNFRYHRFDVVSGLENLNWKDCTSKKKEDKLVQEIEEITKKYLGNDKVQFALTECAEMLVSWRRLRAQTSRWETFAFGSRYHCPLQEKDNCPYSSASSPPFENRDDLYDHLRRYHGTPPADAAHHEEIKNLLERGRTNSD